MYMVERLPWGLDQPEVNKREIKDRGSLRISYVFLSTDRTLAFEPSRVCRL